MKKTIAIIVAAIFVFAIASVSLAAGEKAEMAKPAENTSADVPKATTPTIEKMEKPGELKEQEDQEGQEDQKDQEEQEDQEDQ